MDKNKFHQVLIRNLTIDLDQYQQDLRSLAAKKLSISENSVLQVRLLRRAIDARGKRPKLVLHLAVRLSTPIDSRDSTVLALPDPVALPEPISVKGSPSVVVVGTGPAGMFAAWRLVQAGLSPIVLERGPKFPKRHEAVDRLRTLGELDPEANFHFGLGGAGTYSDGKLYTRLDRPIVKTVLELLHRFGAGSTDDILVEAHPHVGTDRWPKVLTNMMDFLSNNGATFHFETKVTGTIKSKDTITGLILQDGSIHCHAALLAPGNSARDLFHSLAEQSLAIESKAFAVGVRMTHPQSLIDSIQYGRAAGHPALGPASYRLSTRARSRGVYSFCMCPGGVVIPTPTEPGMLAINGMSDSARSSREANAAIVVQVGPDDFPGKGPLAGVEFQRRIEKAAYEAGGEDYGAPAQKLLDFLHGSSGTGHLPNCLYKPGLSRTNLNDLLPHEVAGSLQQGLSTFCKRMKGLAHEKALLLGMESRTSSPVRILRDPDGMSPTLRGLFPAGEGAGYAGGITSSAVDGIRQADALLAYLASIAGK